MKRRILIIDDESGFSKMVKLNLEGTGDYLVTEERDPYRALATALKTRPDLIFLDIVMPGLDGGEVAGRIRAERTLREVPIVFLTAIASKGDLGRQDTIGGFPFLAKPVSVDELRACIERQLGARDG